MAESFLGKSEEKIERINIVGWTFYTNFVGQILFVNTSIKSFHISRGYILYNIHVPCQEIFQVLLVAAIIFQL